MKHKVKLAFSVVFVIGCALFAYSKIARNSPRSLIASESSVEIQQTPTLWEQRLAESPGIEIESTERMLNEINAGVGFQFLPSDSVYVPPDRLFALMNELPGYLVIAIAHDKFEELDNILQAHDVRTTMPFSDALALQRLTSPSFDWRKIQVDKTVVTMFDLGSPEISEQKQKLRKMISASEAVPLGNHLAEIEVHVTAIDGTPNTVSLYVWAPDDGPLQLLTTFTLSSYRTRQ